MEHRLQRKHLLLNPDTNARKEQTKKSPMVARGTEARHVIVGSGGARSF